MSIAKVGSVRLIATTGTANEQSMLSQHQIELFRANGFLQLKEIYSPESAAEIRGKVEDIFASPPSSPLDFDDDPKFGDNRPAIFHRYPQLHHVLFEKRLISSLTALLGDGFALMPGHGAQSRWYSNWHRDTSSPMYANEEFFLEPDGRPIQVAIYLQENGDAGGGLDVISGSHKEVPRLKKLLDLSESAKRAGRMRRALCGIAYRFLEAVQKLAERSHRVHTIESKLGDVVIFDFGILHRATPQMTSERSVRKYAIFFACMRSTAAAGLYR